jgi:hypothetical protein
LAIGMHRGVQAVTAWILENPGFPGIEMRSPAGPAELGELEDALVSPLPSDLRVLLGRWNGARLPSGRLLHAGGFDGDSVLGVLQELAKRRERPADDPELPLPFFRTKEGPLLAFDRGAGPVADTWPVIDCPAEGGEQRLVHRTFDGWCRLLLAELRAPDFAAPFSLEKYLQGGLRHVEIEPDVAAAHATVAHALRRCGRPEDALASYLRAGLCVPPLAWCDWEALKLGVLLGDHDAALAAGRRLCARAPRAAWDARGTTPARVADVVGLLVASFDEPDPLLRLLDPLSAQAYDEEQTRAVSAVRHAVFAGDSLPPPRPLRATLVPAQPDAASWWNAVERAYLEGSVRDEDLLLDPAYRPLAKHRPLSDLLRIRRDF